MPHRPLRQAASSPRTTVSWHGSTSSSGGAGANGVRARRADRRPSFADVEPAVRAACRRCTSPDTRRASTSQQVAAALAGDAARAPAGAIVTGARRAGGAAARRRGAGADRSRRGEARASPRWRAPRGPRAPRGTARRLRRRVVRSPRRRRPARRGGSAHRAVPRRLRARCGRSAPALVRALIYPVPDPALPFLGVHLTRGIDDVVARRRRPRSSPVRAMPTPQRRVRAADLAATLTGRGPGGWRAAGGAPACASSRLAAEPPRAGARRGALRARASRAGDLLPGGAGVRAQALARDGTLVDDFAVSQDGAPRCTSATLRRRPRPRRWRSRGSIADQLAG